jgi:hypothetical protein
MLILFLDDGLMKIEAEGLRNVGGFPNVLTVPSQQNSININIVALNIVADLMTLKLRLWDFSSSCTGCAEGFHDFLQFL